MQGLSGPRLRVAHCDFYSALLAKSSHMAEPRFRELEKDSTSLVGGIAKSHGKGHAYGEG